jgi:cbb3-type cytochrome oxidase maturation protein
MNIILLLIPLSLILLGIGVWAFFWAVDAAQFDDLDTPALMPLADAEAPARVAQDALP